MPKPMIVLSNPEFEKIFNAMFTDPEEQRLKMVTYEGGVFMFPALYTGTGEHMDLMKESIDAAERNLKKAKTAFALFHLMQTHGVTVIEKE